MTINPVTWDTFAQAFNDELLPAMTDTDVVAILWSGNADAKIAVEFGLAVLLDKPIILIVLDGVRVPTRLFDACREVVPCSNGDLDDPDFQRRLREAVER